ncbi:ABC transporter ATP-binding protein [Bacillus cereus]|uniref:ABC transporter ATP-binding protein n=1 Tax=Bacillus cereus TaxID=1396 RepID=UPI000BF25C84|nr:ABC transporter ATP-binding protein [Bacillus cereus]PFB16958.1 ABC transporter ATP-binding protein [Bacillus cereus]
MIELIDVNKIYGQKNLFHNINLTINEGEFVVINGMSGSGKSTLLNIIGHLDQADKGSVKINGNFYNKKKEIQELRKHFFGYIFQNYALLDNESVENNLNLIFKSKIENKMEQIKQVLNMVGLDNTMLKLKVNQLSGGEQQRVAIARVLLKPFKVILADEPTGNLDDKNKVIIFQLLKSIQQNGKTVICVSHDPDIITYATRIITLENNNINITCKENFNELIKVSD